MEGVHFVSPSQPRHVTFNDVDMATLRRIFTEKECVVQRLTRECELNKKSKCPVHPFTRVLQQLLEELVELMQRSVQLWRHLSSVDTTIQSLRKDFNSSLGPAPDPNSSMPESSSHHDSSVTSWLDHPNFDRSDAFSSENGENIDSETEGMDAAELEETLIQIEDVATDVVNDQVRETGTKTSNECINNSNNMKLLQVRGRDSTTSTYRETSAWLKFTYKIPCTILNTPKFQNRMSLTNIAKWRNCPIVMDIDSISKDIFGKGGLPSSIKQIVPRRKLHRQDCVYGSWDSLLSLSEKTRSVYEITKAEDVSLEQQEVVKTDHSDDTEHDSGVSESEEVTTFVEGIRPAGTEDKNTNNSIAEKDDTAVVVDLNEESKNIIESDVSNLNASGRAAVDLCGNAFDFNDIADVKTEIEQDGSPFSDVEETDQNDSSEEAELEFSFLVFRDGFVTCRIMTPTLELRVKDSKERRVDEDWEYLTFVDGKVCFAPYVEELDLQGPFADDETYTIERLFKEDDDNDDAVKDFGENGVSNKERDIEVDCIVQSEGDEHRMTNESPDVHFEESTHSCLDKYYLQESDSTVVTEKETTGETDCTASIVEDIAMLGYGTTSVVEDIAMLGEDKKAVCSYRISSMDSGFGDELTQSFDKSD